MKEPKSSFSFKQLNHATENDVEDDLFAKAIASDFYFTAYNDTEFGPCVTVTPRVSFNFDQCIYDRYMNIDHLMPQSFTEELDSTYFFEDTLGVEDLKKEMIELGFISNSKHDQAVFDMAEYMEEQEENFGIPVVEGNPNSVDILYNQQAPVAFDKLEHVYYALAEIFFVKDKDGEIQVDERMNSILSHVVCATGWTMKGFFERLHQEEEHECPDCKSETEEESKLTELPAINTKKVDNNLN